MDMSEKIRTFVQWINASDNIVFFGGAGVSTESGIPDFRSVDGIYNQEYEYPQETILSHTFYLRKPEEFFKFYKNKMLFPNAMPGITHRKLAELEKYGKLKGIITQNIDGLHQKAESKKVIELHGSVLRNYCESCGTFYDLEWMLSSGEIPICACGSRVKPDVVLYEESLNENDLREAIDLIRVADVMIVGGTSLGVYPAAGLIDYYRGNKLVLINKSSTPYDKKADLLMNESLGKIFERIETGNKADSE